MTDEDDLRNRRREANGRDGLDCGRLIEIKNRIKMAGTPDPLVHCLPVCLIRRPRVVVTGTRMWNDSRADCHDPVRMRPHNDLLVSGQNPLNQFGMFGRADFAAPRQATQVIRPFEHT